MNIRSHLTVFLLCLLVISGCERDTEPAQNTTKPEQKPRVLLVMKSLVNPFYIAMERGARQAAEEDGVELIVRSGTNETLVEQQIEIINEQLALGIDALVIAPADSIAIIPALVRADQQGVKIVNIDNQIDTDAITQAGLPPIPYVSVDNEQGGYLAGQYLASNAPANSKALIIEGPRNAMNARQRRDGAQRALSEHGDLDVIASEEAHWKLEQAYALVKKTHAEHPDLNIVFAANDMMALGVILYAQENALSDWLIGGFDNIPDAEAAVNSGWLEVTIDQQADQQGYRGVKTAVDMIRNNSVKDSVLVDVKVITNQ